MSLGSKPLRGQRFVNATQRLDAGGREKARGNQMDATVDAIVMIRLPREGEYPDSTMRVRYDEAGRTRTLNIMSVQKREFENNMIWLYCREDD